MTAPNFDINSLTLGEIEQVETLARQGIGALGDEKAPKAKLMRALVYVVMRRTDPAAKWEATESLTMADMGRILGDQEKDDQGK